MNTGYFKAQAHRALQIALFGMNGHSKTVAMGQWATLLRLPELKDDWGDLYVLICRVYGPSPFNAIALLRGTQTNSALPPNAMQARAN